MRRIALLLLVIFALTLIPAEVVAVKYDDPASCETCYKRQYVCEDVKKCSTCYKTVKKCSTCYKWVRKCDTCTGYRKVCDWGLRAWDWNGNNRMDINEIHGIVNCVKAGRCSISLLSRAVDYYFSDRQICHYDKYTYSCNCQYVKQGYECNCRYYKQPYECNCRTEKKCGWKTVTYPCYCKPRMVLEVTPSGTVKASSATITIRQYAENPHGSVSPIAIIVYKCLTGDYCGKELKKWKGYCGKSCGWTKTVTLSGYGKYRIHAYACGFTCTSRTVYVELIPPDDRTPPTASLSVDGYYYGRDYVASVHGCGKDNYRMSKVQLYLDGRKIAENSCSASSCCAWKQITLKPGTHTFKVIAFDWKGNKAEKTKTITVEQADLEKPKVSLSPASGTYRGSGEVYSLTVTATASDDVKVSKIELYLNGKLAASKSCSAKSCTLTKTLSLGSGEHYVRAVAVDWKGKRADITYVYTVVVPDRSPPSVSLSPAGGTFYTTGTMHCVKLTAKASDDRPGVELKVYVDGKLSEYRWCRESRTCSVTFTKCMYLGSHEVVVKAIDSAGKEARKVYRYTVKKDMPPEVSLSPAGGTYIAEGSYYALKLTAEAKDDVKVTRIELYVDGQQRLSKPCSGKSCSATATVYLGIGKHEIKVKAADSASRSSMKTYEFVVKGNRAPEVSLSPTGTLYARSAGSFKLTAKASDDVGVASLKIFVDGREAASRKCSGKSCSVTAAAFMNLGKHNVKVVATDTAGKKAAKVFYLTVVRDAAPAISLSPAKIEAGMPVTVEARDDRRVTELKVYVDGREAASSRCGSKTCSVALKPSAGEHTVTAIAKDELGSAKRTFTLIVSMPLKPDVDIYAPRTVETGEDKASVEVTVKAVDNLKVARVELYVDGKKVSERSCEGSTCLLTASVELPVGVHELRAAAVDAAGQKAVEVEKVAVYRSFKKAILSAPYRVVTSADVECRYDDLLYRWVCSVPSSVKPSPGAACYRTAANEWRCDAPTAGARYVGGGIVDVGGAEKSGKILVGKKYSQRYYAYATVKIYRFATVSGDSVTVNAAVAVKEPLETAKFKTYVYVYRNGELLEKFSGEGYKYIQTISVPAAPGDVVKVIAEVVSTQHSSWRGSVSAELKVEPKKPLAPSRPPEVWYVKAYYDGEVGGFGDFGKFKLDGRSYTLHSTVSLVDMVFEDPDYGRFCAYSVKNLLVLSEVDVDGAPAKMDENLKWDFYSEECRSARAGGWPFYCEGSSATYRIPEGTHTVTKTVKYLGGDGDVVKTWHAKVTVKRLPMDFDVSVEVPGELPLMGDLPMYVKVKPKSVSFESFRGFRWCTHELDIRVYVGSEEKKIWDVDACEFKKRLEFSSPVPNRPGASKTITVKVCDAAGGVCKEKKVTVKRGSEFLAGSRITLNVEVEKGYYPVKAAYLQLENGCVIGQLDSKLRSYGEGVGTATFRIRVPAEDTAYRLTVVDEVGNEDELVVKVLASTGEFTRPIDCSGGPVEYGRPRIVITEPADGASFPSAGTVTVKAKAWVEGGAGRITKVVFSAGGRTVTDYDSPYAASFNLGCGEHTITAKAYSSTGKTATDSVTIKVCEVVPTITTPTPTPTTTVTPTPTVCTLPTVKLYGPLAAVAKDPDNGVRLVVEMRDSSGIVKLELYANGKYVMGYPFDGVREYTGELLSPLRAPWTVGLLGLKVGENEVKVVARNACGKTAESSVKIVVKPPDRIAGVLFAQGEGYAIRQWKGISQAACEFTKHAAKVLEALGIHIDTSDCLVVFDQGKRIWKPEGSIYSPMSTKAEFRYDGLYGSTVIALVTDKGDVFDAASLLGSYVKIYTNSMKEALNIVKSKLPGRYEWAVGSIKPQVVEVKVFARHDEAYEFMKSAGFPSIAANALKEIWEKAGIGKDPAFWYFVRIKDDVGVVDGEVTLTYRSATETVDTDVGTGFGQFAYNPIGKSVRAEMILESLGWESNLDSIDGIRQTSELFTTPPKTGDTVTMKITLHDADGRTTTVTKTFKFEKGRWVLQ